MMTGKEVFEKLGYRSTNVKSIDARLFVDPKRDTATAYLKINDNPVELVVGFKDVFERTDDRYSTTVKSKDTKQTVSGVYCVLWAPVDDIDTWQFEFATEDKSEKIVFHLDSIVTSLTDFLTNEKKGGLVAKGKWEKIPESIHFNDWLKPIKTTTPSILSMLKEMNNRSD